MRELFSVLTFFIFLYGAKLTYVIKGFTTTTWTEFCHLFCVYRRACEHVDVGTCPHQVLAATLTLSQPGGADYAPPPHLFLTRNY